MAEHAGDYEWRGEGEEAEISIFAPDGRMAEPGIQRALPAARLPGADGPVYAATSSEGFGWVAASTTHAAPDIISVPRRGVLLVADVLVGELDPAPPEILPLLLRNLSEINLPRLNESGVRRICEEGAMAAAEDAMIEAEDLELLDPPPGDPDALGRRALSAGTRDWEINPEEFRVMQAGEVFDAEAAEELGLRPGTLAIVLDVGAGELGRLALAAHGERIAGRDFGREGLPAAPVETEEAADLISALGAASNFAVGRATLLVHATRRAISGVAGRLEVRASWQIGGVEGAGDLLVHRNDLASARVERVICAGGVVAVGTGNMLGSAPCFGAPEENGLWPWEEAGLLERWAKLEEPGG